ncbi:TPA: hypothetical protein PXJ90_004045 [Yersinia enterocolitica]|nr:hypothetical protein [Yersinia enterocolitica]HDM8387155.1 hypothetical protein [Yersinia enterocolitica]
MHQFSYNENFRGIAIPEHNKKIKCLQVRLKELEDMQQNEVLTDEQNTEISNIHKEIEYRKKLISDIQNNN